MTGTQSRQMELNLSLLIHFGPVLVWHVTKVRSNCKWFKQCHIKLNDNFMRIKESFALDDNFGVVWNGLHSYQSSFPATQSWYYCHFCIAYVVKRKIISGKKLPAMSIEPGPCDALSCLPDWANLASVNWGIFNFTFVGVRIDFWTLMI